MKKYFCHFSLPLWIPKFLVKYKQFKAAVIDRASVNNPLREALELGKIENSNSVKVDRYNLPIELNLAKHLHNFQQNLSRQSTIPPWLYQDAFPQSPVSDSYGFCLGDKAYSCSQASLLEKLQKDSKKQITLIWTPDTDRLVVPEEIPSLFEAVRRRENQFAQLVQSNAALNFLIWGLLILLNLKQPLIAQFLLFNWIAISVIPLIESTWSRYRLRFYSPLLMSKRIDEVRYFAWVKNAKATWTVYLTGCIVIVGAVQVFTVIQGKSSILAAGIVKSAVWQGEIWRLLTGTLLHGNIIHFLFNILALFGLSKLIEVTAHRVYLPIIFLLSALSGSLASLIFLPNVNSVGASGGIMGLVGFLMVLVGKNRRFLPSKFFRGLLLAVFLTLATGLLASQIIDNAAHLGGLLGGIMLGVCLIPQHQPTLPIAVSSALSRIGILASVVIGTIAIVACLKMLFC